MRRRGLAGDQAEGLRRLQDDKPVKVITVTGGKGGVGKSIICANLGVAMAMMGRRVMLLDGDLGLANIDVMFGLQPGKTLADLVHDQAPLEDIVLNGPEGLMVVPGASGLSDMADLSPAHHIGIVNAFSELKVGIDTLLVDTAAGIADGALRFAEAAQEVIIVVCDESTSITDSYAIIKVLSTERGVSRFRIVTNMTRAGGTGTRLFQKLLRVTDRFLDVTLDHAGSIPYDDRVWQSIQKQVPFVTAYPGSLASQSLKKLAIAADRWQVPTEARGNIEFFVDRLLHGEVQPENAVA
jgi:flagellar biosynthesis protein FlhG